VLDDLPPRRSEECLLSLEHAVEHMPPGVRIVATTRSTRRFRSGGCGARALGEIRAADLAFRSDEAREMLVVQEASRSTTRRRSARRADRGLACRALLAALWLRGSAEPKVEVAAFHGSHRHVAEYSRASCSTRSTTNSPLPDRDVDAAAVHRGALRRRARAHRLGRPAAGDRAHERLPRCA